MSAAPWDRFVTDRDRAVFRAAGYGVRGAFPQRPVLLLVDFTRENADCPGAAAATRSAEALATTARAAGLPVICAAPATRADGWDRRARPEAAEELGPVAATAFTEGMGPRPTDIEIRRHAPSAFFDSDLMSFLNLLGADGLVLVGGPTSDSLRATAIDAFSLNLRVAIATDACFDTWEASHAIALCDLDAKYADALPSAEIAERIGALPRGLFDLPPGSRERRPDLGPRPRPWNP